MGAGDRRAEGDAEHVALLQDEMSAAGEVHRVPKVVSPSEGRRHMEFDGGDDAGKELASATA